MNSCNSHVVFFFKIQKENMSRVNPVCILGRGEVFYVEAPKKIVLLGKTIKKQALYQLYHSHRTLAGHCMMVNVSIIHSYFENHFNSCAAPINFTLMLRNFIKNTNIQFHNEISCKNKYRLHTRIQYRHIYLKKKIIIVPVNLLQYIAYIKVCDQLPYINRSRSLTLAVFVLCAHLNVHF